MEETNIMQETKQKRTRRTLKLTLAMAAKWWGISRAAMYQAPTARREQIMREFKRAVESGGTPDPRLEFGKTK
jgi:hypothetical protein